MSGKVVRDEVTKVRTVVSVGPVDGDALGTFGWFILKYGTCVICRRRFADDDQIHMVGNVVRNGKTVGNRLCCSTCAEEHILPAHQQAWLDGFLDGYHETLCTDPDCTNPAHLPEPDDWTDAEEDAAWLWDDDRARRRSDV